MPLPDDPLGRYWLEFNNDENPELVSGLRPAIIGFLAFDRGSSPGLAGTGFFIAGTPEFGAVLSARHVVVKGVFDIQTPNPVFAPSALFVPESRYAPKLDPGRLKVLWMGACSDEVGALDMPWLNFNSTDIACGIVTQQAEHRIPFNPTVIPIDTAVPAVGDIVHMVSQAEMSVNETVRPQGRGLLGQELTIARRISIRRGLVTGVYGSYRQYGWPCFTTSIPADPGMSGGFVYIPRPDGEVVAACGVVCADNSLDNARTDFRVCGESVIGCTWPALGLRYPEGLPANHETPSKTIYEMMLEGNLPMAIGGIDRISIRDDGEGNVQMSWRA